MNQNDKEAFEKWFKKERELLEAREPTTYTDSEEWLMTKGWQAACEYKKKDIDKDKILILELSVENAYYLDLIAKLQDENANLRESLEKKQLPHK